MLIMVTLMNIMNNCCPRTYPVNLNQENKVNNHNHLYHLLMIILIKSAIVNYRIMDNSDIK
jgi:hypothetical protein